MPAQECLDGAQLRVNAARDIHSLRLDEHVRLEPGVGALAGWAVPDEREVYSPIPLPSVPRGTGEGCNFHLYVGSSCLRRRAAFLLFGSSSSDRL